MEHIACRDAFAIFLIFGFFQHSMSACHFPSPYYISDSKYLNILEEHSIVKYNDNLIFGVVYDDYQILSSLTNYAKSNVDGWRRKTLGEIVEMFRNSNYGQSFVSMCSCSIPVADGRYCCSVENCNIGCLSCTTCIGSNDYHAGFKCDQKQLMYDVMSHYSKLESSHNTLHRTKRHFENYTNITAVSVRTRIKRGKNNKPTGSAPTRKPLHRKCKNNVKYCTSSEEESSSNESNAESNHCKVNDAKITDRLTFEGCAKWCPRGVCVCKYTKGNIGNAGYNYNHGIRYYCTDL